MTGDLALAPARAGDNRAGIDDVLRVEGLRVEFPTRDGVVRAVAGVDFAIRRGRMVGLVGESGSGKTVAAYSILRAVASPGRITAGRVLFRPDGPGTDVIDLTALDPRGEAIRHVRGRQIAMIYQEPMTALSMMHRIGFQIEESILVHEPVGQREARRRAIEMLGQVGIARPDRTIDAYPFELSGGMRQRAMIAMGLVARPQLLLADEPTTALDVTTQAGILALLAGLQRDLGMAVLLITHDLGVVAESCEDVVVMYLGEVMETGSVRRVFAAPRHPYTRALLRSVPRLGHGRRWPLVPIAGAVPGPFDRPSGCPFHPRCPEAIPGTCDTIRPPAVTNAAGDTVRCHLEVPTPGAIGVDAVATGARGDR